MYIKDITVFNFRNYKEEHIEFCPNINVLYGNNAQGKTNIIESIYMCSMGKSFRAYKDAEIISFAKEKSKIQINFVKSDREKSVVLEIYPDKKKEIYINDVPKKRISDILGNINIVIFSPDDIEMLKQGPSLRRRFLDVMISQLKPNYLNILSSYLKTINQRNIFLRQLRNNSSHIQMLDVWDEKIAKLGINIYNYRKEFVSKIYDKIQKIHEFLTDNDERLDVSYLSECTDYDKYLNLLKSSRQLDILKGYTTHGIHRDDLSFFINEKKVNVYGSQGQHRTTILSLKLAEMEVIYDELEEYPILLLDDVMSELDSVRRNKLLEKIKDNQVIITATDRLQLDECKEFYVKMRKSLRRRKVICMLI